MIVNIAGVGSYAFVKSPDNTQKSWKMILIQLNSNEIYHHYSDHPFVPGRHFWGDTKTV